MALESLTGTFLLLKKYYSKIFKSGSMTLAILIPITLLLAELGFLNPSTITLITTIIIFISLVEVLFNIVINKYESTKARMATLKRNISIQDNVALEGYIENDKTVSATLKTEAISLISALTEFLKNKKTGLPELEALEQALKDNSVLPENPNLIVNEEGAVLER